MPLKRLDPIGAIPRHRRGVPVRHKAVGALAKPAALLDEVANPPLTRRALARQSGAKLAGAVGHVGAIMILGKAATGHDAFAISKGLKPAHIAALERITGARGARGVRGVGVTPRQSRYARERLAINRQGKVAPETYRDAPRSPFLGQKAMPGGHRRNEHLRGLTPKPVSKMPAGMRGSLQPRNDPYNGSVPYRAKVAARKRKAGIGGQ